MIQFLRYLLLMCLICSWPAQASTLMLKAQATNTNGYLERLTDPTGALDAANALASSDWIELPGPLNASFTYDVIWLKLQIQAEQAAPTAWMLSLSNALLDEVTLYDLSQDGTIRERHSGETLDRTLWPVNYRTASFPISLKNGEPHTLLLRLKTKNAMSVSARLMPESQFHQQARNEYLGLGLYFGIYLALIVFHSVFWRMTNAPESGWYLIYVSCCFLIESFSTGLIQQATGLPVAWSDRMLGCIMAASLPIGFIFAQRQLQISEFAGLRRILTGICLVVSALAATTILFGHYQIGAPLTQVFSLLNIALLISTALWLLLKGQKSARVFLLVFGIYYAGVIISFMRNLGVIPTTFMTDNAVAIGTLLHMALMSMRIIHHYRTLEEDKRRAQLDFKLLLQEHNSNLEQQIVERTQELREEISRRTLLEGELRETLHQEKRTREEQRDFVAMVSHEFRTPLAIISTSAQQISRNLSAAPERNEKRCKNIREASSRLLTLVDHYLSHDRMEGTTAIQCDTDHALQPLMERSSADLPTGRIVIRNLSAQDAIRCDDSLIKIALRNLLANADRHAPAGSAIELRLSDRPGFLDIQISNEGPAIPEDQSRLLFQKYFRGSQAQHSPGAGLGLHLAKRIIELHGGDICLESRGEETPICFRLSLPLGTAAAPAV